MHKFLSPALLGLGLVSTACRSKTEQPITPSALESRANHTQASDDPPPLREQAEDPADTGTAMSLTEGKMGKKDPQHSQQEAIEQARTAGVVGATATGSYGTIGQGQAGAFGMGRGAGVADVSSGFDASNLAGAEAYHDWGKNPWTDASKDQLSTFAADVDTASYTIARRKLNEGTLPPPAAVRVEEFVNYFRYAFPAPAASTPFAVVMDAAPSPLSPGHHILRVGVATRPKSVAERKPAHLVFLVDVSDSMASPDKLELAKRSLRILTDNLKDGDTVSLVTYAGDSRLVLPPTGLAHKAQILAAIEELHTGGSTAMASGIDLAYQQAMKGLVPGAISRVIVCTDGDANVGSHTHDEILRIIAGRAKEGVTLSTIGFGMGNYKDELMEQLADKGNGNNFYIDSLSAAKKVFQEQLGGTLEVVAKDVKLQVDFDPQLVSRYRLIGYENRDIRDDDFRNDRVDAGEIGAGHQVTAVYDVELTARGKLAHAPLGSIRIRHKQPTAEKATEAAFPMIGGATESFANAPTDFRFAFAVAAFADVLRGGPDAEHWSLAEIRDLARRAAGDDADRTELVGLIERAIAYRKAQVRAGG
ncbi:MAG TPA: VWA domain-containing protein [Kofleriaceae bacterium]|jgi:Ca-activated chloride channel family protein|nr:VWA domain-containing protein [Kofleriaceae bacterium]